MRMYQPYKKHEGGGPLEFGSIVAGTGASVLDAINPPNQYGNQGMGTNIAKSALTLGATGAQFGPIGAAAGAIIGAGVGVIQGRKQQEEARRLQAQHDNSVRQTQISQYQARAAQDPSLISGTKGANYYANGGDLFSDFTRFKAKGGSLSRLSSDSVAINGPSHAQGGVKLNTGDEVEGGETIKGDYVFSKKLGFAQLHKPLAKTIHKLEERPVTKTSLGSLSRLRKREDALMLLQEMVRHQNHLQ